VIERTTHPAGFKVTDRRGEHRVTFDTVPAPDAGEYADGVTVEADGLYRIEGGTVSLAELRRAKAVISGTYGTHAAPMHNDTRRTNYDLQECVRRGWFGPTFTPTARQQRRINKKGRRLTSTAGVK
jgi:hypothetical protein